MRRALLAAALAIAMLASAALAEVYEGTTVAAAYLPVEAAASGTLQTLCAANGSAVSAGDLLGAVSTTKVFASQDGVIARIYAAEGDSAEDGALDIYPMEQFQIYCTVDGAYETAEDMLVHSGENVYIRCTTDGSHRGTGVITQIDSDEYRVLATGGEFYVGETVYLYRDADYSKDQRIGIGTVVTNDVQSYSAIGTIVQMHVTEGEYVERGELLFEYADSDTTALSAPADGIIAVIVAAQGDRVEKGAALMQIAPYDQIYVEIQVAEVDIGNAQAGDSVEMIYNADAAEEAVSGTIERISRIAENNAYAVLIRPDDAPCTLLGATVSVRLTDA